MWLGPNKFMDIGIDYRRKESGMPYLRKTSALRHIRGCTCTNAESTTFSRLTL